MRLLPLVPAGLPARRRRGGVLGASVLLHAALLAALLVGVRRPVAPAPAPSYELVFENAAGGQAPTAVDQGESQPRAEASAAAPDAPEPSPRLEDAVPAPEPAPAPVVAAAPAPAALPLEALPGPELPSPTAPPLADAPPVPPAPSRLAMRSEPEPVPEPRVEPPAAAVPEPDAPPAATRPEVRLELPEPPAPPPPLVPEFTPPAPPPPLPALSVLPTPPARPRTAPPRASTLGSLANPMDLDFSRAPRLPAPRVGAARGSVASRSIDLSTGAAKPGPNRQEAFFDARAVKLGADWMAGVRAYWLRHRYYPEQAAQNGEDGTVDVELVVNSYGRVLSATVTSRSGSNFLDMAAVGTFRGAQLPPLPREVGAPYTVTLTINYILVR